MSRYQLGKHLHESQSRSELGGEENPTYPRGKLEQAAQASDSPSLTD